MERKPDWRKSGSPAEVHPSAVGGRYAEVVRKLSEVAEVRRKPVGSAGEGSGSWVTVQAKRAAPEGPLTCSFYPHSVPCIHLLFLMKPQLCI